MSSLTSARATSVPGADVGSALGTVVADARTEVVGSGTDDDDDADTCGRSGEPQDASVVVSRMADQASVARLRNVLR